MISSRVGPFVAFWYCNSYVPRGTFPYLSVNTLRSSHLSSTHVLLKKSHTQNLLLPEFWHTLGISSWPF